MRNTRNLVGKQIFKEGAVNKCQMQEKKRLVNQTIDLELGFRLQKTRLLATKKKKPNFS